MDNVIGIFSMRCKELRIAEAKRKKQAENWKKEVRELYIKRRRSQFVLVK